jgi:hypothetical protein
MASKTKPNKFWESLENTLLEAKEVMKKHNYDKLPSSRKLRELGYNSLDFAINYHGGFPNFREKHLGEKLSIKPSKYWYSLENTIYESKKVMEEQGVDTLPTQKKLEEIGCAGLTNAINRHHGGLPNFREKHLGEEPLRKPHGYWEILENTIYEAKKVKEEYGLDILPSTNKLNEISCGGLATAIKEYHGGFPNFREKHLGEKLSRKPRNYWKSLENTISGSKEVMEEIGVDRLPSGYKLTKLGYGWLMNAISRHHGGFTNFREILNQEIGIKSKEEHLTELVEDYLKD